MKLALPRLHLMLAVAVLVLAGCAGVGPARVSPEIESARAASSCAAWLSAVDRAVDEGGVRDAGAHRVAGFPYLRMDRFTASFRLQAAKDTTMLGAWSAEARAIDRAGRSAELRNLPAGTIASLGATSVGEALSRTESCAEERMRSEFADPTARQAAIANSVVPDDYLTANRVLGLYALARLPFSIGVEGSQRETLDAFRAHASGGRPAAVTVRYGPPGGSTAVREDLSALLRRERDAFGRPRLAPQELERLFDAFAPVFEVEATGEFDRLGTVGYGADGTARADTSQPVVYRRLAYTRFRGETLPQLVYTVWFSERPRSSTFDVLAGRLDGIVWRLTLGLDGTPLVADSMHPCGCYHMFFPSKGLRERPPPVQGDEWAFSPARLPETQPGERVLLHIESRTHYLVGIGVARDGASVRYGAKDEDELRSLAQPAGGRRSLYGPEGLVAGSERSERFFFWPMGVPSAGAMRQWGRHATAFLGRRHFDDPFLIEERFEGDPR